MKHKDITIVLLLYKTPKKLLKNFKSYKSFNILILDQSNDLKMKKHLEKNKGKFNWMELMYTPNWGEEFLGFKMNDYQKEQMQKLKDRFGENEIPEGIASTGTALELGTMFLADPFILWGAGSKLSKLKCKKDKYLTEDEIFAFCNDKLASFKRPEKIIFISELPRNSMGKILKKDLRDKFSA